MSERLADAAGGGRVPTFELDHLVVAASSLDVGRRWCAATLGVEPANGGRHVAMGTHNVLVSLATPDQPRRYLEIIAIDADAPAPVGHKRWFDLDTPRLRAAVSAAPTLVHWVARTDDIEAATAMLRAAGHDVGTPTAAERATANGVLRWRITLTADGVRPAGGAVPLLIEWGDVHPADSLPASGVTLLSMRLGGIHDLLAESLSGTHSDGGAAPALAIELQGQRGLVQLATPGL